MSTLLRKLDKKIWLDRQVAERLGSLQADALKNFKTTENKLSVFLSDDVEPDRILTAIASSRDKVAEIDYAVFDDKVLKQAAIKSEKTKGETPDDVVNMHHIDLIDLTAQQIHDLASFIQNYGVLQRHSKKSVVKLLNQAIVDGRLENSKINTKLLAELQQVKNSPVY